MNSTNGTERAQHDRVSVFTRTFARFSQKFSDIILAALLAFGIAIFTYGLSAQARMAERVRQNETQTALNTQSVSGIKEAIEKTEKTLTIQICAILETVDHRFESLERMLAIALETNVKGE